MGESKPLVMIVDDNKDILFNLKIILETRGYKVITTPSGEEAINILSTITDEPEVIISDIMMPNMNGYEFFTSVSKLHQLNRIPFLFLTAKSTPEDIRFGKMLGVDDYITKPFKVEDLVASISGKISRNRNSKLIDNKVKQLLTPLDEELHPSISKSGKFPFYLLLVFWDDIAGPILKKSYPPEDTCKISINTIGRQLFHAATSIYGQDKITKAEGILLNIENIGKKGYLFFDSSPGEHERYGEKQYMLSVIAPNITFFDSLKVKAIFKDISEKIKENRDWQIKDYWEKILKVLSTGSFLLNPQ
ncbi:MAG: response regulator [Promethearchaeota archaeon]|jgi:CheY-like chemotaxis protein